MDQIASLWASIVDYFTDPFWGYLAWGAMIVLVAAAVGWFFESVRSLAGAVILATIGMLFAYRRGQGDEKARQERRQKRPSADNWWRW